MKKSVLLYSIKPDSSRVYAAENTILPHVQQDKPYNVKELHDYFLGNPYKALQEFDSKRLDVSGVVLRVGPDGVFGQPCAELSDKMGGKCYVLCIFQETPKVKTGDNISVRGNYLVTRGDYGIVLKISEII